MVQMHAFKSSMDYHTHLLLMITLNDGIINSGIIHKYSTNYGIICTLKIQPEVIKRKQSDQDGKKFGFPIFWEKRK